MTNNNKRKSVYNKKNWQDLRAAYKAQAGGLCERCLERGIITAGEIVHHKQYVTDMNMNDPDVVLNPENLMLLCRDCHAKIHSGKRYKVDGNGRLLF